MTRRLPLATLLLTTLLLSGCGFFAKKPSEDKNPLTTTECPKELPPLTEPSMGAQGKLMIEWAGIYHSCRTAGKTGEKK